MSKKVFIARENLARALDSLSERMDVWIPAATGAEKLGVEFVQYRPGMTPVLDRQSNAPPKKVLLPQVERLLSFEYKKAPDDPSKVKVQLDDETEVRPSLVFGGRPCDVKGFLVFDQVFTNGPFKDKYYRDRREKTYFATLLCREADEACFCSSVGSGPADRAGSDIWATPVEGGYVLEALGERAQPLMDLMSCDAPTEMQEEEARRAQEELSLPQAGAYELAESSSAFRERFEDKGYWREMAGQCLSCGVCTFLCPTCYCFTITDEVHELLGERLRSWDSCMFYHYSLEASGHNPRPTRLERYRNRVGHKFSYIPDKYAGMIGCCGCGRCIRSCPVSIDIRMVVQHLKEKACACS